MWAEGVKEIVFVFISFFKLFIHVVCLDPLVLNTDAALEAFDLFCLVWDSEASLTVCTCTGTSPSQL